jgi:diaminopimelate decarboxylase
MMTPSSFPYKNSALHCEQVPVKEIIAQTGTPVYIYSKHSFLLQLQHLKDAFAPLANRIFYAVKANFNLSVIRLFHKAGCGVDVNSAGELFRARKAGVPAGNIIFAGVGKTPEEIETALLAGIHLLKIESYEEAQLVHTIAKKLQLRAPCALRVNPDVDAGTHPHISTGLANNKFGIPIEAAEQIFTSPEFRNITFTGIDMHLGSQITAVEPYLAAAERIAALALQVKQYGVPIAHIDIGGGFAVPYLHESQFDLSMLMRELKRILSKVNVDIYLEPGRFLTANAGILVTRVLYNKQNGSKNFVVVDAAMTELLRPALYGAHHGIVPVTPRSKRGEIICDVVGPVCESSDAFAKDRKLQAVQHGELLAIMGAGAYGMVMSSNYNARPRPPEVLVDGAQYKVIRTRESFADLVRLER